MKTVVATIGALIAIAALAGLTVVNTGLFNVATTWDDPGLVRWALETTRENSIERHAAGITAPPLNEVKKIENGFRSYREMCAICHTFPGGKESPVTKGLNPKPPKLKKVADKIPPAELFWVIKNGIRMTGMPGWGETHEDNEIWDIVAFVKTMPKMSKADYQALDSRLPKGHHHGGGGHDEEDEDHDHDHEEAGDTDHHSHGAAEEHEEGAGHNEGDHAHEANESAALKNHDATGEQADAHPHSEGDSHKNDPAH